LTKTAAIHRFTLTAPTCKIEMPEGAVILSAVPTQSGLQIYALVETGAKPEDRHFVLVKTGQELPGAIWDARFILSLPGAHLFETQNPFQF
jgi:hypothetical protein